MPEEKRATEVEGGEAREPLLLRLDEAAPLLAMTPSMLRKLIDEREFPEDCVVRWRGSGTRELIRVKREGLEKFIEAHVERSHPSYGWTMPYPKKRRRTTK